MAQPSRMVEHHVPITPYWKKLIDASYKTQIGKLELSFRVQWRLYYVGIKTLKQLCNKTPDQIRQIKGLGRKSVFEIQEILASKGLCLKGDKGLLQLYKERYNA